MGDGVDSNDRRFEKGFFTRLRLGVAEKYIYPPGRGPLFLAGAAGIVILAGVFLADAFVGRAALVSQGPLSENHALFGNECSTCHVPFEGVPNASCENCHQQFGTELGVYSFERHYVYRSRDFDRSAPSSMEIPCATCHREHRGQERPLAQVADQYCLSCHTFGSFENGHPEFRFAAENLADPANLRFPHVLHVREIMEEFDYVDVEAACLRCHTPQADGRGFEPISFARQCDQCHLTPSAATPYLPLRAGNAEGPGVRSLADVRRIGGPDALWADYWNPNEFRERPGEIQKRPVFHEDPWVLHNLRELRRELYPGAELADLLTTSPEVPARQVPALYREAVATLREQIQALRGDPSPEVQREIATLSGLLDRIEQRTERPFAPLDESRFEVSVADRAPDVDEVAYRTVIDSLTAQCQSCHVVERATIRRVQTDQRTLVRAEFDHRAHVIHARCLDCHNAIPIREALLTGEDPPAVLDRAEIVNLPTIETCQSCHTARGPAARCTSCHLFHPDKAHWANLSR